MGSVPSFGDKHCGPRLSAFVDGELGHRDRERVLGHLATCPECRAEADALRALKGRLRTLDAPLPADLTVTLLGMTGPPPAAPPTRPIRRPSSAGGPGGRGPAGGPGGRGPAGGPGGRGRTAGAGPSDNRPRAGGAGTVRRPPSQATSTRRRGVRYTAFGMLSAAVAVGAMLIVTAEPDVPDVAPQLSDLGPRGTASLAPEIPAAPAEEKVLERRP